jgi:hypothetical protein
MLRPRVGPREGMSSECQRNCNTLRVLKEAKGVVLWYDIEYNLLDIRS